MFNKKEFEDFIERLRYHNKGDGVQKHGTADPIFMVQKKELIFGLEDGYADYYVWVDTSDDGDVFERRGGKLYRVRIQTATDVLRKQNR